MRHNRSTILLAAIFSASFTGALLGPALARPDGGGGSETPCWIPKEGGSNSCTFWIDMTDPADCPDDLLGGSMLPDVESGSPGHDSWVANGTASCQVNIKYLYAPMGEGCHSVGGWTTQIMSGRVPSGNPC